MKNQTEMMMLGSVLSTLAAAGCGSSSSSGDVNAVSFPAGTTKLATPTINFTMTAPNTPLSVEVTFSGETLGINGLPFQPVNQGDPYFVDGWNMTIDEDIVVVGDIALNSMPTEDQTWFDMGPQVAHKAGPYVFDAHQAAGFVGKDGIEPASPMFVFDKEDNGSSFDSNQRYAFSYDTVVAAYPAWNLNLTTQGQADYDLMVSNGWGKFIRATASYVGTGSYPDAATQTKFNAFPTTVTFTMGWNDATSNTNCVNADLGAEDDLMNRGVVIFPDQASVAQMTMHVDHVFWDKLKQEGAALRFDPIAAFAPADTSTTPFSLNTFHSQHLLATFADGSPLPDRAPDQPNPSPNAGANTPDDVQPNPLQVTFNLNGVTKPDGTAFPDDLVQFMAFSAQSQMHLNAQGLCYIKGQNPADPFYAPMVQ
ncbi:MAG TPA: hypothetical protein VH853_08300 [Polyangia bacterium]|jgi:hypothetical protein|nr:hypothetical protein [Polyangia bacterium]